MKSISRGAGQAIVAAAAYRHACRLEDTRTGEVHDYTRKQGLELSAIYLPSGINAEWAMDRSQLWNAVEAAEKRVNSRLGRDIVLALPSELSEAQRRELAGEMARHLADRYGVAVDVAIHQPSRQGDQRNYHVHMLMSSRRLTPQGFGEKARELDDRERGPAEVENIRVAWADMANRALGRAGQHVQIDHRSLKAQGAKRLASLHLGPSASAMERRGIATRIGDRNRSCVQIEGRAREFEATRAMLDKAPRTPQEAARVLETREARNVAQGQECAQNALRAQEWAGCREGARQKGKEAEKVQLDVVPHKETREELENRIYGKTERQKTTSEIYGEALELYRKDFENSKKVVKETVNHIVIDKNSLEGSELIKIVNSRIKQVKEVLAELDIANQNLTNATHALSEAQNFLDEHNKKFELMGIFKKILNTFEINKRADYGEKQLKLCEIEYANKKQLVNELKKKSDKYKTRAMNARSEYENSPHGKAMKKAAMERAELEKQYGMAIRKLVCPDATSVAQTHVEYKQYLDKMTEATSDQRTEMVKNLQHAELRYEVQKLFYTVAERTSNDTSISGRQRVRDKMLKEWDNSIPEQRAQMEQAAKDFVKTHQRSRSTGIGR